MCHEKNKRMWWAIWSLFTIMCSVVGAGATMAISYNREVSTNTAHIAANDRTILNVQQSLVRIDDKLDRVLMKLRN